MLVLSWYRNQSIDLHSTSMDWFLYEGNTDFYLNKKLFKRLLELKNSKK